MAIVAVTHELGSINTIADRAVMLARGPRRSPGAWPRCAPIPTSACRRSSSARLLPSDAGPSLLDELEWSR